AIFVAASRTHSFSGNQRKGASQNVGRRRSLAIAGAAHQKIRGEPRKIPRRSPRITENQPSYFLSNLAFSIGRPRVAAGTTLCVAVSSAGAIAAGNSAVRPSELPA